jgi:hypothetical protein
MWPDLLNAYSDILDKVYGRLSNLRLYSCISVIFRDQVFEYEDFVILYSCYGNIFMMKFHNQQMYFCLPVH